ncbi:4Fe-4S dicluster domain-containing protein [candidate division KSB1 bacterium]|nr:4Fe-4S dicluster domain-containing protein [candidate division KSB1 bacterium]
MQTRRKVITESIITFSFFLLIGVLLWQSNGHIFFLFNFIYIGIAASAGELLFGLLPREKKIWGRKLSQVLIGLYMLGVLGFLGRENMQLEGFFFYLLAGIFSGPVLHYLIAKIGGVFLFGRGWCGWACWTTMVVDFLPWMKPAKGRLHYWGLFRYFHFFASMILVLVFWYGYRMHDFYQQSLVELNWLIIGNVFYFSIAILLAAALKDNRAFCKYVCPIPVLMKPGSRFSIWKMEIDADKCTDCRLCEKNCPMNIRLLSYMRKGQRILSTECIACQQCANICPEQAIQYSKKYDAGFQEYLNFSDKKKSSSVSKK